MTAQDERAVVIAWLRQQDKLVRSYRREVANLEQVAGAIERGDHITPGGDHAKD